MDKKEATTKDNPKHPKMEQLSSKDSRYDALHRKYYRCKEKLAKTEEVLANSKSRAKYGWDRAKIELAKTKKELTETKKELRETKVKLDAEEKWHAYYRNVSEQYHKCMTGMNDSLKETSMVFDSMERLRKKKRKTNSMEPMMKKAKTTGEGDGEDKN